MARSTSTATAPPPQPERPTELPADLEGFTAPLRRPSARGFAAIAIALALVVWAADGAEFGFGRLISGTPNMAEFLARLWPPTFDQLPRILTLLLQTVQMALIGTLLGCALALLLSFTAAQNIAPAPVYRASRLVLNALRSIPELVLALMFVTAVGLGPFAGVLAIAIGSIGTMAKVYAEAIEAVDRGPLEAMRAVGASRAQTIAFGILPQAMPLITSYTLLLWEGNVRAATILGLVGAGGIGLELTIAMRLYDFGHLFAIVICIVVLVTLIDRLSAALRARLT